MTAALSHLSGLRELGLSVLSGLGWQPGPDASDRAKLLQKKPAVFGAHFTLPDADARKANRAWEQIVKQQAQYVRHLEHATSRSFFGTVRQTVGRSVPAMSVRARGKPKDGPPPMMFNGKNMEAEVAPRIPNRVIRLSTPRDAEGDSTSTATTPAPPFSKEPLLPNALTLDQQEWLMEMEWAQRAFLTSWCLALLDNPAIFETLRTFNIANISSKYLDELQREDIWRALPKLENLTVLVSPDWRRVCKNPEGMVYTSTIMPSDTQTLFWSFLCTLFQEDRKIKILKLGYVGGGEHATGMYARNHNVLPAPIMEFAEPRQQVTIQGTKVFSQIEKLTLSNCWLTPEAVKIFFAAMEGSSLQEVTFDSVSLSASANSSPTWDATHTHEPNAWRTKDPIPGSWSAVLNTITPCQRIEEARYLHGLLLDKPETHMTSIQTLRFDSCGYVKLLHMTGLDQSTIGEPAQVPSCLKTRLLDLSTVMMESKDPYLGTIVPIIANEDAGCLGAVFGMRLGWPDERREKFDNREDGQCLGGEGRFSGVLR